jgi:hypothetical protein
LGLIAIDSGANDSMPVICEVTAGPVIVRRCRPERGSQMSIVAGGRVAKAATAFAESLGKCTTASSEPSVEKSASSATPVPGSRRSSVPVRESHTSASPLPTVVTSRDPE